MTGAVKQYEDVLERAIEVLDEMTTVNGPISEYLQALYDAQARIDDWFEATVEAAKDDLAESAK